jgi:hypothetical protein
MIDKFVDRYPLEHARQQGFVPDESNVRLFLENSNSGDLLRKALARNTPYSAILIDHCLLHVGMDLGTKVRRIYFMVSVIE